MRPLAWGVAVGLLLAGAPAPADDCVFIGEQFGLQLVSVERDGLPEADLSPWTGFTVTITWYPGTLHWSARAGGAADFDASYDRR